MLASTRHFVARTRARAGATLGVVFDRRARAMTRVTMAIGGFGMSSSLMANDHGDHGAWGVVGFIGVAVCLLSFPTQIYTLYL